MVSTWTVHGMSVGRMRGDIRQTEYNHQNHGERKLNLRRNRTLTRASQQTIKLRCSACTKVLTIDFHDEDPARRPAVAATICSSQRRRDASVLRSLPFNALGLWVPSLVYNAHDGLRVPLGQDWQLGRSLLGCQPGSYESAPLDAWSVLGSPPLQQDPPLPGGRRPLTQCPRRR